MLVYRIGKSKYANDLTGKARNYTEADGIMRAFHAFMQRKQGTQFAGILSAYYDRGHTPSLKFTSIEIPDNLIHEIKRAELPANWQEWPHPKEARDFGNKLLIANKQLAIRFPSAIIPEEFIYIINPVHQHMRQVSVKKLLTFLMIFD